MTYNYEVLPKGLKDSLESDVSTLISDIRCCGCPRSDAEIQSLSASVIMKVLLAIKPDCFEESIGITNIILKTVEKVGDPLFDHFKKAVDQEAADGYLMPMTEEERNELLDNVVRTMVLTNVLRMKEDSCDHDWAYVKGSNWENRRKNV